MGLFSGSKEIFVSSTVYNMAGEEATRPDFLKNTIYGAIISPYDHWLGETIANNLLIGPGMQQRHYFNWAVRQNYAGLPTYSVSRLKSVDPTVVAGEITIPSSPSGLLLAMQTANVVSGSYEWIVEDHVLENFPGRYDNDYVASYDKTTNDITISWATPFSGTTVFSAGTYDPSKTYIVAEHYFYLASALGSLNTGSTTVGVLTKPSTSGYIFDSDSNRGVTDYDMNYDERIVVTYEGPGKPADTDDTTSEMDSVGFDLLDETWTKTTFEGGDGNTEETISRDHFLEIFEYREIYTHNAVVSVVVNEDTPIAGVTQTITTWRDGDWLRDIWDWRIDTQDSTLDEMHDGVHIFSYEEGTGNTTLDALIVDVSTTDAEAEYFPYMPLRLDNDSITHADYADPPGGSGLYEQTNRAYRRASGGGHRLSKLLDEIEDNEDIDDIDYAFIQHGVQLNVIEPACRRYMYTWFKTISSHQNTSSTYMDDYATDVADYVSDVSDYNDWIFDQGLFSRTLYGDPRPDRPKLDSAETTTIKLVCADSQLKNLDMRVSWINITETLHSGAPTNPETMVAAVEGDIYWKDATDLSWDVVSGIYPFASTKSFNIEKQELYWQTGSNAYKKLVIWGLVHQNYVYKGEAVTITGKEGVADTEPTGFIIPQHYGTVKDLGLVDATQMATANTNIIFNSYEIVKKKWYEGFIGMLIIIIVIVILAVIFAPAAAGASGGLLGTNAAVGAAIGLSGTAAIVAGAIINALVAIAVSKIITAVSGELFGDKWGPVIAAVVNLAITMGASGAFSTESFSELLTAENLMAMSSAVANGYQGYTQGAIAEMSVDLEEEREETEEKIDEIGKMLIELRGGDSGLMFDPLRLTDSVRGNDTSDVGGGYITETLEGFIHRTTMVGSDIVEIQLSLVNNFANLSRGAVAIQSR